MKLGLNLSFAVKRWMEPDLLARMIKEDFNIDHVQFSWDFIDPWWPETERGMIAKEFRRAFEAEQVSIECTFGGNAAYVFPHFLAPIKVQRQLALEYFRRASDLTLELGAKTMGAPMGALSYSEARDPDTREKRYQEMLESLRLMAMYGKNIGLESIEIEATPLFTEIPYDPDGSVRLMEDLSDSAIPIKLLIDWGHALFKPLLKENADINVWFEKCAHYIGSIHLQQTDGIWDRHWDFTHEGGIITPDLIAIATHQAGLDDIYQYLEVVTSYEDDDDQVYERMKHTMDYLHRTLKV